MNHNDYQKLIKDIPDYPTPGVVFKDVTPIMADPSGFAAVVDELSNHFLGKNVNKVIGAEARGFLVGAPVAYRLGAGFIAARKPGKLPREVYSESYELEYGKEELQIHKDAIQPGDRCLVVDDLVATGGTAVACAKLIEKSQGELVGFGFLMQLDFLHPEEIIRKHYDQDIFSLIHVAD